MGGWNGTYTEMKVEMDKSSQVPVLSLFWSAFCHFCQTEVPFFYHFVILLYDGKPFLYCIYDLIFTV
jgi:thioredoxin-like negative regulator of GroEL